MENFTLKRCAALLNMYLMALYGQGQYVETYYDRQIYLNHKLIEERKLNLVKWWRVPLNLWCKWWVQNAYSTQRLLFGSLDSEDWKNWNTYNPNCSGDIYVEVMPGWSVVNEYSQKVEVVREAYTTAPLVFMGFDVKPWKALFSVKLLQLYPL